MFSNPKHYDLRLISQTPDPRNNSKETSSRDFYSFLGKTKDDLEEEREGRIKLFKKRKHDASTALMASLGQKIERYGKKY